MSTVTTETGVLPLQDDASDLLGRIELLTLD